MKYNDKHQNHHSDEPIVVLDSGVGGLSVAKAIQTLLPKERIIYCADTLNLPYGYKSHEVIKFLGENFIKSALQKNPCKALVIACHTLSVLFDKIDFGVPTVNMIEPTFLGTKEIIAKHSLKSLGMLCTKATYESRQYRNFFSPLVNFWPIPMGYLVHLVEDSDLSLETIETLLTQILPTDFFQNDALILGCTHFSALKKPLKAVMKKNCIIIDPAFLAAQAIAELLDKKQLLITPASSQKSLEKFYVTDNPKRFLEASSRFTKISPSSISLL